jgi:tyrosyl-tRNA synthetase
MLVNIEEQVTYLMQGTDYGDEEVKHAMTLELRSRLEEAAKEKRPLRLYCGYDPTKADLHLGHTVTMRKLAQFQELGHEVTFLIGDYTALIGDPSDKDVTRPILSAQQVQENARTYAEQAFRILDPAKTKIRYNSEWLSRISFAELIRLASNFTIQQFMSREKFKLRWERGEAIFLHETFYAVMQGFDAYNLQADVQVGGTDQFFNIVTASRKIMTALGLKPNIGICLPILPGTDGVQKMSKSLGNDIPIQTTAQDMYGKLMSIPDQVMALYFKLVTHMTTAQIDQVEIGLKDGSLHPRDAKMMLAKHVTTIFYGEKQALGAQDDFVQRFQLHSVPEDVIEYSISGETTILESMVSSGLVSSKSEGRRMIEQKGVRLDGKVVEDLNAVIQKGVLQVGKRKAIRLI